jgi:uncharacterized Zn-binding protein involved in type VI secretion
VQASRQAAATAASGQRAAFHGDALEQGADTLLVSTVSPPRNRPGISRR